MLEALLNCPKRQDQLHYHYLPVSTSYKQELIKMSDKITKPQKHITKINNQFIANQDFQNVKDQLVLLKLKGYIDQRDITGKSTQIKKLPSKIQVGTYIEGDPIVASKLRLKKKQNNFIQQFLKLDSQKKFTQKKFGQLQRQNQRRKKLKKKIIAKKQKQNNKKK